MTRKAMILLVSLLFVMMVGSVYASPGPERVEPVLTAADVDQTFKQGSKVRMNNISVVSLHGTWREMGRQYGMLMKDELHEVYDFVESMTTLRSENAERSESIIALDKAQYTNTIREFMEGASETSGLTIDQVQAVNALERIGGLPKCSAAFCWDDYSSGQLIVGRNYDYSNAFVPLKDDMVITVYHPADGSLAVATIGYAGEINTYNAINEKGIFMELNNGTPSTNIKTRTDRIQGTTMLFSAMFETDELKDWELFFNTVACSGSYITNVADSQSARSYEWCPTGAKTGNTDLPDGLLVSTNYYVNPDWPFATPSDANSWEGLTRRSNLITLCENFKGMIDARQMREIIETPVENGGATNELTMYQIVMIPETKMLWLQVVGGSEWTQIDLSGFLD